MKKYSFTPSQIFNLDESGIQTVPNNIFPKHVAPTGKEELPRQWRLVGSIRWWGQNPEHIIVSTHILDFNFLQKVLFFYSYEYHVLYVNTEVNTESRY